VLQEHPELTNVKGKFEIAYKVAKAQKLEEVAKQAYENGKQDSQKVKELKSQQIIEKSKAIQDTPSPDDEILNGILKSGGKWGAFGI
jgi:hypothetical protein